MELWQLIIAIIVVIILIIIIFRNKLVKLQNTIKNSKSSIDVYLKQRFELIPNLVETVKGYAKHEQNLFKEVTEARSKYNKTESLVDGEITNNGLNKIIVLAESYPELKANEQFLFLQKELAKMESQLQAARRVYNSEVNRYNDIVMTFPGSLFAGMCGFKKEEYFEAKAEEQENVEIKL